MAPKYARLFKIQEPVPGSNQNIRRVIARGRTRTLLVATGGKYKFHVVGKIVNYLRDAFLEVKQRKLSFDDLMEAVDETDISEEIKLWLIDEALPNHPRIRALSNNAYTYKPPIACKSAKNLETILKNNHEKAEGGLLRSIVENSMPNASSCIQTLLDEKRIVQIRRLDKSYVLFCKVPDPTLDNCVMDPRLKELWRRANVSNKEMDNIKTYLKNQGIQTFDAKTYDKNNGAHAQTCDEDNRKKRKRPAPSTLKPIRRRSKRKIRDNIHVEGELDLELGDHYDA